MSVRRFYINAYPNDEVFHGGIGNIDIEKILAASGFEPITFSYHFTFTVKAKLARFIYLLRMLLILPAGSIVIYQFPLYAKMHKLLVQGLLKKRVKVFCFIADINGLKDGDNILLQHEVNELKKHKYFIVHNHNMAHWINKLVAGARTSEIEFFDFLSTPVRSDRKKSKAIVFAGNLEKSKFLEKLNLIKDPQLRFQLYGAGVTKKMLDQDGVLYKGVFAPYALPAQLEGSFGLVWDGDSIEGPGGSLGNYMQYISHHKLSLYILSGLPLIVPSFAGSASLVEKYNIGFTINSLDEISRKIEELQEMDYQQMIRNMQPLALKISSGQCLLEALGQLMDSKPIDVSVNKAKNLAEASY